MVLSHCKSCFSVMAVLIRVFGIITVGLQGSTTNSRCQCADPGVRRGRRKRGEDGKGTLKTFGMHIAQSHCPLPD